MYEGTQLTLQPSSWSTSSTRTISSCNHSKVGQRSRATCSAGAPRRNVSPPAEVSLTRAPRISRSAVRQGRQAVTEPRCRVLRCPAGGLPYTDFEDSVLRSSSRARSCAGVLQEDALPEDPSLDSASSGAICMWVPEAEPKTLQRPDCGEHKALLAVRGWRPSTSCRSCLVCRPAKFAWIPDRQKFAWIADLPNLPGSPSCLRSHDWRTTPGGTELKTVNNLISVIPHDEGGNCGGIRGEATGGDAPFVSSATRARLWATQLTAERWRHQIVS